MAGVIRAVLFDLDNTLADREQAFTAWAAQFARSRLGISDPNEIESFVAQVTVLDADGRTPKHGMLQALNARYPVLTDEHGALALAFQDEILANLPFLNHAAARLIAELNHASMPWGIVSNSSRNQLRKIAKLGLGDRASCILLSEVVGKRKPHPVIFRLAAEHLGLAPESVLFVGDHPVADIIGAAAAGMATAWLRRGRQWPTAGGSLTPDFVIESLADLLWVAGAAAHEGNQRQTKE